MSQQTPKTTPVLEDSGASAAELLQRAAADREQQREAEAAREGGVRQ